MKVFWDVDGTLISHTPDHPIQKVEDRVLRPYAKEVIDALESFGIENYLWSRAGQGNACEVAHRLELPEGRCYAKPEFETPDDLRGIPVTPDLVVDDNPDESILVYPHILVSTYYGSPDDSELLEILPKIREHYDAVHPDDPLAEVRVRFKRKGRTPLAVKMKRKRYYRQHRGKYRRYRRRYRRRPRFKRIQKIRRRLMKRLGRKLRRYRMRVTV